MTDLVPFEGVGIRSDLHEGQRWFSVVDVIGILTGSVDPSKYWSVVKRRDAAEAKKEGGVGQLSTVCRKFKFLAPDGKMRATDCATPEGLLRIIQSVPSPKAEPLKLWLAQVGYERIQEDQDPELAINRAKDQFRAMGMPEELVALRLDGIQERQRLTDEWKARGVQDGREYGILTAIIAEQAVGKRPSDHKVMKGLKMGENLRDNMTPMEMLLTQLGEAATTEITRAKDAQGFRQNEATAREGGGIAGKARRDIEAATGKPVATGESPLKEARKRLQAPKTMPPPAPSDES
ncbi:MAG: Bro-N domain-containing protein [Candidatus Sericytochromatia bacterium]|nr:Bro-N domain-containing protein [Candidatus Sericytochromatia bacterium]